MNENNPTVSFDRMRNMLTRAAEIRESEQQQIFDALDEIHARLSPLESIGSVRKRLSEMPDRTEVSVLAERLDEAMSKLEAQDTAIAAIGRAVESIVDKLATPFAQLDGRLDGVAGRFEGVAGRMDGLEDKLASIHRRIDELDHHLDKQDGKIDQVPGSVHGPVRERIEILETALRGRIDEVDEGVHEHLDGTKDALARTVTEAADAVVGKVDLTTGRVDAVHGKVTDSTNALHGRFTETSDSLHGKLDAVATGLDATRDALDTSVGESRDALHGKLDEATGALREALRETRETVDASERLESLAQRLETVTARLDEMATRLDTVEDGFTAKLGDLGGSIERGLTKVEGTLSHRPDSDSVESLVRRSNDESVRRIGGHLDEAMATFAELMLGGGQPTPPPPTTLPRQGNRRRTNGKGPKSADKVRDENNEESDIAAGA
ncbi:hyprothetical protein [Actinokineospora spheciospongiae]|uniref:Hyprothetical protein n=2 Tax=Actinokineospora spheciospongiae TaxID=909613 RepID=W7IVD6_9PSEU|nr:apolipoprotein A1/A4/E domain-containing protein [Actinokineospora spheciospongiae]EWC60712.1 hyprothetical protein [Actinokineospora spheciospongiae]